MRVSVTIPESIYSQLYSHLYPGDGLEAVALALCGRLAHGDDQKLLFHKLIPIPYHDCEIRNESRVTWKTTLLQPLLIEASKKNLSIVKAHSHPGGFNSFSQTDNTSDSELFESVFGWIDSKDIHASMIMLPDGELFGRYINHEMNFYPIDRITVVGDDIKFWPTYINKSNSEEFNLRTEQLFGPKTMHMLKNLKVGVVGCSGTGSPTIEQLARLGVGHLVLVDPDHIEEKNLNRILNSKMTDALAKEKKVDVIKGAIDRMGLKTNALSISKNLYDDIDAIKEIASCDIVFGCVDSVDGRHLLNLISSFYLIPYFDLGVKLLSDGRGGIDKIVGSVHYIKPGGGSLMSRGVYSSEDLRAASIFRAQRDNYNSLKESGYIVDVNVDSPAVISINMSVSAFGVNEFLARLHPFRSELNKEFDITRLSISDGYTMHESDETVDPFFEKYVGRGDMNPFLNLPELKP